MSVALVNDPVLYSAEVFLNDTIANGLDVQYHYKTVLPDAPADFIFRVNAITLATLDDAAYPATTQAPAITAAALAQGLVWP